MPRRFRLLALAAPVVVVAFGAVPSADESAHGRTLADVTVTVTVNGTGNGRVVDGATLLRCGVGTLRATNTRCSRTLPEEHFPYFLGVFPQKPSVFVGWSGCDRLQGGGQTCVLIEAYNRTVTATINLPPPPPPPAPAPPGGGGGETPPAVPDAEEKKRLRKLALEWDGAADNYWGVAGISAVGATVVPVLGVVAVVSGIWGIMHKNIATDIGKLAEDPPDPRYNFVASLRPRRLAPVKPTRTVKPRLALAVTRMRTESARLEPTLAAVLHSVERAQGAARARDWRWVAWHRAAAARHARAAATQLERMGALRTNVVSALGRVNARATPAQVRRAQATLRRNGLAARARTELRAAGYTKAEIATFVRFARTSDPPATPVTLRGAIADPRLRAAEQAAAASLRRFAARAERRP